MSHLSILPTLVTDLDLLEIALTSEGFKVLRRGVVSSFDSHQSVDLAAVHPSGLQLGWRQSDNAPHFDLVADLAAPEGSGMTESVLRRVLRRYAMTQAMRQAEIFEAETVTAGI
ncbi:hypothetical protein MITS9509_01685 [Synechococcus sp. MIT S9509]|uniref:DUF1257 domain-containing protein n=1 Tax=unclassified Synechococcus TaxID=2626047 RepID=UPI0007BB68CE|nr:MULTISPECIES: DUF1257 domain-containing protein [unclassified Synechococcus]KZR87990.1 hypothetical protein MITS9504_00415 [Synechococcus sp. MIT S9504]KZR92225.1 hypothetical protein MITS9509_01685 [Synechococcus sp. MIT S9509]